MIPYGQDYSCGHMKPWGGCCGESQESNGNLSKQETGPDSFPSTATSDQGKGQQDTGDTPCENPRDDALLAKLRNGEWLDKQEFPALQFAVDGLIPEGLTLLVGAPKAGKSWLVLGVLLAVAAGEHALEKIKLGEARRVLYLALEDGDRRMQDRCRQLLADTPIPGMFHYLTQVPPGEVEATIDAYLRRYADTALVVIDTLGKVMPPASPNETTYQRDYRVGGRLKAIADRNAGLSVVVLHHDRKAASEDFVERVSGTNGLAGAADTIILLSRKRQSRDAVLSVTGRDVEESEYAIIFDSGAWVLDGDDLESAATAARSKAEQSDGLSDTTTKIIAHVTAAGPEGTTRQDVLKKFGEHAGRYLARLVKGGRIKRIARGRYAIPDRVPSVPLSRTQANEQINDAPGTDKETGTVLFEADERVRRERS